MEPGKHRAGVSGNRNSPERGCVSREWIGFTGRTDMLTAEAAGMFMIPAAFLYAPDFMRRRFYVNDSGEEFNVFL